MPKTSSKKDVEIKKAEGAPAPKETGHPLSDLHAEIDRLFSDFSSRFPSFARGTDLFDWEPFRSYGARLGVSSPRVDLSETDKGYKVTAELPGMDEKDISVELKDNVLTIGGEKKEERDEEEKDFHVSERRYGSFRRTFRLPAEVNEEKTSASFRNGVLIVEIPKTGESAKKSRKIKIGSK